MGKSINSLKIAYYFYSNPYNGERYFKVEEGKDVVMQIIESNGQEKRGRPYVIGVSYIKYMSFLSSWGWRLKESKNIKVISEKKFNKVLDKMIKKFTK